MKKTSLHWEAGITKRARESHRWGKKEIQKETVIFHRCLNNCGIIKCKNVDWSVWILWWYNSDFFNTAILGEEGEEGEEAIKNINTLTCDEYIMKSVLK